MDEAADAVALLAARGQHDHRQALGFRPRADAAAQLDAGEPGQHPVEQHDVGHLLAQADLRLVAAGHAVHLVAFGLEVVAQEEHQGLLILHDQNARPHGQAPTSSEASIERSFFGRSMARVSPVTR